MESNSFLKVKLRTEYFFNKESQSSLASRSVSRGFYTLVEMYDDGYVWLNSKGNEIDTPWRIEELNTLKDNIDKL